MLLHATQTFQPNPGCAEQLRDELTYYYHLLRQEGYICGRDWGVYGEKECEAFYLSGVLQHPTALQDAASHPDFARHESALKPLLRKPPTVDIRDLTNSEGDHYCEHVDWNSLIIITDPIGGMSPISCGECDGYVATYRLKTSSESGLCGWDRLYRYFEQIWLMSGEYEEWTEKELRDASSTVNQLGRRVSEYLRGELGCSVDYHLFTGEDDLYREDDDEPLDCPACGKPLAEVSGTRWAADHLIRTGKWTADSLGAFKANLIESNPGGVNTLSVHVYPQALEKRFGQESVSYEALFGAIMDASMQSKKPVFVGEFGAGLKDLGPAESKRQILEQFEAMEKANIPLAAVWVYDLQQQEGTHSIRPDNERAWILETIRDANQRLRQASPR